MSPAPPPAPPPAAPEPAAEAPAGRALWRRVFALPRALGDGVLGVLEAVGDAMLLAARSLLLAVLPRYRPRLLLDQLQFAGVMSLPIVLLTGLFTGMVFALQSVKVFATFNVETVVGGTVTLALCRELAPVLTGLIVTGRVGSAMATEIGTMRVTEQIDALEALAVDPVQYLFSPRVVAGILIMPMLTLYFDVIGVFGAWLVAVPLSGVDEGFFFGNIRRMVTYDDVFQGVIKGTVFGALMTVIACRQGFRAAGGARGVGEATTSAVVWSSVAILGTNYILTALLL